MVMIAHTNTYTQIHMHTFVIPELLPIPILANERKNQFNEKMEKWDQIKKVSGVFSGMGCIDERHMDPIPSIPQNNETEGWNIVWHILHWHVNLTRVEAARTS